MRRKCFRCKEHSKTLAVRIKLFVILGFTLATGLKGFSQGFFDTYALGVNNINVSAGLHGDFWHNWNGSSIVPGLEFPKGSGKFLGISMSLWMAGHDSSNVLKAVATTYRHQGQEYWPGPLQGQATTLSFTESEKWAKIWHVKRSEINLFLQQPTHTLINTPISILEWPAKGNIYAKGRNSVSLNITESMAPFVDVNSDGYYDPLIGDYPLMKGDEMQWLVFNDAGPIPHNEITQSLPMGVDVKMMIYATNRTGAIGNIVFYEFDIRNKSQAFTSFSLGLFADVDLGIASDDYVGFDSARNMCYFYNGTPNDGGGVSSGYADSLPMVGVRFLEFPSNDCNVGTHLGSFISIDEARNATAFPNSAADVYNYLNHTWRDSTPVRSPSYHPVTLDAYSDGYGGYGAIKKYVYDGMPTNFGPWSQCNFQSPMKDRRGIIAIEPRSLSVNNNIHLAIALIVSPKAKSNGCPSVNFSQLNAYADSAVHFYCNPPTSIPSLSLLGVDMFPNPTKSRLSIKLSDEYRENLMIEVRDVLGNIIPVSMSEQGHLLVIEMEPLPKGVYSVSLITKTNKANQTVIKL